MTSTNPSSAGHRNSIQNAGSGTPLHDQASIPYRTSRVAAPNRADLKWKPTGPTIEEQIAQRSSFGRTIFDANLNEITEKINNMDANLSKRLEDMQMGLDTKMGKFTKENESRLDRMSKKYQGKLGSLPPQTAGKSDGRM
ncbi:hypothetical protein BU26DRAFT_604247 [Trematosphaeria pertusa]|uniref:Uncharacterized protein n=1 Tax=Trematosphaeria pertusa TaxID=390896 RepID=A0A6A6IID7_9PLEO|nr:uncharacterized protein BU26DRAFT_604247 [Trematosphaeria pertusa]KAF2249969.1 hypothetical protein BU26DRAFT_604247 [Trematosphaeria pertusa]